MLMKKKQILYYLHGAKREETKAKRLAVVMAGLAEGKFPFKT